MAAGKAVKEYWYAVLMIALGALALQAAGVTVPPDSVFISTYVGPRWLSAKESRWLQSRG